MPINEYMQRLDSNGYAPSIMDTTANLCYLCGATTPTERHEVFGGPLRNKSKSLGLWVNLCPGCHRTSPFAVHQDAGEAAELKHFTQMVAMEHYRWSMDEWKRRFYKNYLFMEEENV